MYQELSQMMSPGSAWTCSGGTQGCVANASMKAWGPLVGHTHSKPSLSCRPRQLAQHNTHLPDCPGRFTAMGVLPSQVWAQPDLVLPAGAWPGLLLRPCSQP